MNTLLLYFAFPLAVIIVSAVLEKLIRNPIAVAALAFAVFLVLTFTVFDETFLIATLAYTIISLITAAIVHFLKRRNRCNREGYDILTEIIENNNNCNNNSCNENNTDNNIYDCNADRNNYRRR